MTMKNIIRVLVFAIFMVLSITFLVSCANREEMTESNEKVVTIDKQAKIVHVYFFDGFNQLLGNQTVNDLRQTFDSVVFEGEIPFPDSAYYAPRNRYKADKLVKHLRHLQASSSDLVVGFSPKDISDRVHGYEDFGVMGWTRISVHSSVVSTHRLADKSRLQSDFLKLVLHEMGHADGLPHCKNSSSCYMRDANKQNHFPELNGFCDKCKRHLVRKGWKL